MSMLITNPTPRILAYALAKENTGYTAGVGTTFTFDTAVDNPDSIFDAGVTNSQMVIPAAYQSNGYAAFMDISIEFASSGSAYKCGVGLVSAVAGPVLTNQGLNYSGFVGTTSNGVVRMNYILPLAGVEWLYTTSQENVAGNPTIQTNHTYWRLFIVRYDMTKVTTWSGV